MYHLLVYLLLGVIYNLENKWMTKKQIKLKVFDVKIFKFNLPIFSGNKNILVKEKLLAISW